MNNSSKKIVLALSGGVDSCVAASLLKSGGFEVFAAYFVMSDAHQSGVKDAKDAADTLRIPLSVIDLRERFDRLVAVPFCKSYCGGVTPNPCVGCNPAVKFAALAEHADLLGAKYISSGHYARNAEKDGVFVLRRAACEARDQSYMLCRLPQSVLSRFVFPLGELTKDEVRKIARETGLSCADSPDSQEICFIPDGDYAKYINGRGFFGKTGFLISPDGERLAESRGAEYYTIGQRRGLGVTLGKPLYVKRICENGDILLGWADEVFGRSVTIQDPVVSPAYRIKEGDIFTAKPRSAAKPDECEIASASPDSITVSFPRPLRAAAPGQELVLYDGEFVAGCGRIASVE